MKRRHWMRLGIAFEILAVAAVLLAIALPKFLDLNRYRGLVAAEVQKAVGGAVRLERLSWGIANGIWLTADGLSIADASAFPGDLWVSRIRARLRVRPLLRKQIVLDSLVVEQPEVRLRLAPGRQAAAQPAEPAPLGPPPAGTPVPVRIERLTVQKGRFRLEDALTLPGQDLVRVFHEVDIQAGPLIPGQPITFAVALRDEAPLGLGALQAHGTFSGLTPALGLDHPKLALEASLTSLHTEAIRPYLGDSPLSQRVSGSLSLTLRYEGDLDAQHRAQGILDLGQLAYADPSLWDAELAGAGMTVGYHARLERTTLTVEELTVKRGTLALTARGVVESLSEQPVLRNLVLASDVALRELVPLIPWRLLGKSAAALRGALEDGGRVVIDRAALPDLSLAQPPATLEEVLRDIELTGRVEGVSVPISPAAPRIRNVSGSVRLARGAAELEGLRSQVGSVRLPAISARITRLLAQPRVEGTVTGQLKVERATGEDVAALLRRIGLEEAQGAADLDLAFALDTANPQDIRVQGRIGLRDVALKAALSPARLEGLAADLTLTPDAVNIADLSTTLAVPAAGSAPAGRIGLRLQGRIDGWRRQPAVTLQRLATSPVPLRVAASLVPWEKVGASTGPLKDILLAGGRLTIEELVLPRIALSGTPPDLVRLLPKVKAAASFADLAFQPDPDLPRLERMAGRATLEGGVVTATKIRGAFGPWTLPEVTVRVARLEGPPAVSLTGKGLLQAQTTQDPNVEELLKRYGLKSLTGSATVDMQVDFDPRLSDGWRIRGSVVLAGVRAETFPHAVVLDNLRGRLFVNRGKTIDIAAEEVTGQVDGAPVRLSGTARGLGTPDLAIAGSAYAKGLDLARAREFFPALRNLELAGTLDMDVKVSLPAATAADTRLDGSLTTTGLGFRLPAHGLTVTGGAGEIALRGNSANILRMHLQVNDQMLAVTGQIANPMLPDIRLVVTSPELGLDRLLPPDTAAPSTPSPLPGTGRPEVTPRKAELPAVARKLTAQLQVVAKQGQYRGLRFRDLTLGAAYERGLVPRWDLDFSIEGGRVRASGSADLRDPGRIPFVLRPHITSPQLEQLAPVLGFAQAPATGPLSLTGDLHGQTGDTKDLLTSLGGTLAVRLGPGRYARIGKFGGAMAKILSFGSARGLLSGRLMEDLTGRGLPYQTITAEATFDAGSMDVGSFSFQSDAMSLAASGRVDLLNEQMDMQATLGVLGVVDKVLQYVPILGEPTQALTSLHLRLTGPLDDPNVRIAMGEGTKEAVTGGTMDIGAILKGVNDFLRKGFNTLLGK